MNNWILIGLTSVMTGFILFVRFTDWVKHRQLKRIFFEQNPDHEVVLQKDKTIWIYAGSAVFAAGFALMVDGDIFERIVLSSLFFFLVVSEGVNAWIHSALYTSSKGFFYGLMSERFRSIKTFKAKGKRKQILYTLKNQEYIIPNAVAKAIQLQQRNLKNAKKS